MADRPPPAGWQQPDADGAPAPELPRELIELLRERVPAELSVRLLDAVRELLVAMRALIDVYLERGVADRDGATGTEGRDARDAREVREVRDIPIS